MLKSTFGKGIEAGCDEVGRGALAGPVMSAAVILPKEFFHPLLKDSKKMTAKQRDTLAVVLYKEAIAIGIGSASPEEVDDLNVLQATFLAMHRAIDALCQREIPDLLLIDGNRFRPHARAIPHRTVIKGDSIYMSIAAASVLAKTERDKYMQELARHHPHYGWNTNVGYPTLQHREALTRLGTTPYHRKRFVQKFLP